MLDQPLIRRRRRSRTTHGVRIGRLNMPSSWTHSFLFPPCMRASAGRQNPLPAGTQLTHYSFAIHSPCPIPCHRPLVFVKKIRVVIRWNNISS